MISSKALAVVFFAQFMMAGVVLAQNPSRLSLAQGSTLKVVSEMKSAVSQEMMGQQMDFNFDVTTTQTINIKEKKPKSYVLSTSITAMKMVGSMMGRDLNFDSDNKEDLQSDMGKGIGTVLNAVKEVEMGEDAKVIVAFSDPTKKDDASSDPVAQMLNSFGGAADASYGTQIAFTVIPSGVKVGDSWSDSVISENVKIYRTYVLKSSDKEESAFAFSGKQVVTQKTTRNGMDIVVTIGGNMTGEGTVSRKAGIIRHISVATDATGTTEVMGQTIPLTSKMTSTAVVTEL